MSEIVETASWKLDGLIVIDSHGAVWMVIALSKWHPLSWFRQLAFLGNKHSWLLLQTKQGRIRAEALRLSRTHVRFGRCV